MLKFKQIISEVLQLTALYEAKAAEDNESGKKADAKGKAFEIEFARHMHPKKEYPTHYRDEDGKRPEEIAAQLRELFGSERYNSISEHARIAAEHYRDHLHEQGHMKRSESPDIIAWTSQRSDHKSFTGKEDPNANADVMIRKGRKYRGISLKYGSKPGLRSPGLKDLAAMMKLNHGHIQPQIDSHMEDIHEGMKKYIKSKTATARHEEFKAVKEGGTPAAKAAAEEALQKSRDFRAGLVHIYVNGFNRLKPADALHAVRRLSSAEDTVHVHDKVHFDDKKGKVHISRPVEDFNAAHSQVHHYSAEARGGYMLIHAHDKQGRKHQLLRMSIKNKSSSPYTNIVGAVQHGKDFHDLVQQGYDANAAE